MSKAKQHVSLWRRTANRLVYGWRGAAAILVLAPLFAILFYLVYKGVGAINWEFLTNTPQPVGEAGGGMGNAITRLRVDSRYRQPDRGAARDRSGHLRLGIRAREDMPTWFASRRMCSTAFHRL